MLCHEFCCLHSRACSLALAAVSRHEEGCLGPRFLSDPSSSSSPFEPIPGPSSAVNCRPVAGLPSCPHLPSLTLSPIFRVAFHCERSWHHRQQRHRSRLGKSAAETISPIAHRSFGRPGVRKARAERVGNHGMPRGARHTGMSWFRTLLSFFRRYCLPPDATLFLHYSVLIALFNTDIIIQY